jgi:hypothetical protein
LVSVVLPSVSDTDSQPWRTMALLPLTAIFTSVHSGDFTTALRARIALMNPALVSIRPAESP